MHVNATIKADGTAGNKIIFTSIKDDDHGGDTNEDGSVTEPSANDWNDITLNLGGSKFNNCEFYYSGDNTIIVSASDSKETITNNIFAHNGNGGSIDCGAVVDLGNAHYQTKLQNNIFYDNAKPVLINPAISIDTTDITSNIYHNPADTDQKNTFNGIFVSGWTNSLTQIKWGTSEIPFVINDGVGISLGATLTLKDNVILKFLKDVGLSVKGTLIANASPGKKILFTSIKNDILGDTNGDSDITEPAANDWCRIYITDSGSKFNNCEFSYSGSYYGITIGVESNSKVTITNSVFDNNSSGGGIDSGATIDLFYAHNQTVFNHNTFYNNTKPLVINPEISIDTTNIFHNPNAPEQKNTFNGIFVSGTSSNPATIWSATEVPFVLSSGYGYERVYIDTAATLTLKDNVVLKFMKDEGLTVNGTLIADASSGKKIVFTSIKDDNHGGDTNHDGDITVPAANDWNNIKFSDSGSKLNNCEFFYSGSYSGNTVTVDNNSNVIITNCIFANNGSGRGIDSDATVEAYYANSLTTISKNIFYNNDKPLAINPNMSIDTTSIQANIFHNPDNSDQKNKFNAIFTGGDLSTQVKWGTTEVPFVLEYLGIYEGTSLTLKNNVVLKFTKNGNIGWDGGTFVYDNPGVWFTSIKDDNLLGDTNGDGSITTPAMGDWQGISFWETLPDNFKYAH